MIRDTPKLRKFLLLLSTVWAALVVGWILWSLGIFNLFFPDDKNAAESDYSLSDLPFEYVVDATWLDEQKLLLTIGENLTEYDEYTRDVIVYDWGNQQTLISYNDVLGASDYSGYSCISKHGVFLTAIVNSNGENNYHEMHIPDPLNPSIFTETDHSYDDNSDFEWQVNPLDCQPFKDPKIAPQIHTSDSGEVLKPYRSRQVGYPKRLSSDGLTSTLTDSQGNIYIKGMLPTTNSYDNTSLSIPPFANTFRPNLLSQWSTVNNAYFFSNTISNFSQDPAKFKNTARLVSKNLKLITEYNIPAGPWIYNSGYRHCFSCGCSCYDRMHLKLSGDSIFALISGHGVRQKHKGVYRLNQGETWEHILRGADTRAFAINENQCLIATGGHNPKVTDICSAKP
jgi:hypothetical protein